MSKKNTFDGEIVGRQQVSSDALLTKRKPNLIKRASEILEIFYGIFVATEENMSSNISLIPSLHRDEVVSVGRENKEWR